MKKYVDGEYIEMTPEEIEEMAAEAENTPPPEPTEEKLAALMAAIEGGLTNG